MRLSWRTGLCSIDNGDREGEGEGGSGLSGPGSEESDPHCTTAHHAAKGSTHLVLYQQRCNMA